MEATVIIPAHNEEKHIQEVIQKVKKYADKIIVIDDGSSDDTFNLAKQEKVTVLHNLINVGKGAALRTGCDYAFSRGAKAVIALDADGQHDPDKIPEFLAKLNESEIVFGYRKFSESMPFVLRFGNWFINKTTFLLYSLNLNDTQCGYRAFTLTAYKKIRWYVSDYSMESEMISRAGKNKLAYSEVPIQTIYNDKYKGTTIVDGVKIVLKMFWWRLS
ncbi:MAG TPA: glycosyltransferase family 2 protein [Candidatus Nanoarchaeia archaeon]|nr:glycosyltransferase family 2 protein [Candidatus Nanoarchaeia archaeon]